MLKVIYGINRRRLAAEMRRQLAAHQKESPYSRGFLLVPEQQKAGLERRYFMEDRARSLMLEEVLSFRRFALRLAEIGGGSAQKHLSPGLQTFLLGRLIEKHKDELQAFGRAMFRPSFLALVSEAIGDFLRYEISPAQLREAASRAAADGEPRLEARLRDMALITEAYAGQFRQLGALPGDLLLNDLLAGLQQLKAELERVSGDWQKLSFPWKNYAFLRDSSIWIHGFGVSRSLTPQEYRVAALLTSLCREVVITAESDILPQSQREVKRGSPCFRAGRELLRQLAADFPQAEFQAFDAVPALQPAAERPAAFAARALPQPRYHIQHFTSAYDELRWTAGEIKRLLHEEEAAPQEIGIALAKPELSQDMQLALQELDLPYYTTDSLQTAIGAFSRFNKALSDVLRGGFERDYLLPLLRSPYLGLTLDEADMLDNFMLARGLEYDRLWDDRRYAAVWRGEQITEDPNAESETPEAAPQTAREVSRAQEAALCLELRNRALGEIKKLYDVTRSQHSAPFFAAALLDFFSRAGLEGKVAEQQKLLLEQGLADEAEHESKSWNMTLELLADFIGSGEEALLPIEDFLYYYEEALAQSANRRIPAAGNQIILGSVNQLAQEDCRYLFVLGAEQNAFPGKGFRTGLFQAPDRQKIGTYLAKAFPDATEQRIFANASHLYALLFLPEKSVYLSYAGSPDKFSPAVESLAKELGVPFLEHPTAFGLRDPLLAEPARAFAYVQAQEAAAGAELAETVAEAEELKAFLAGDETLSRLLQLAGEPQRELAAEGRLEIAPALVRAVLGDGSTWSISRLERYSACPFSFFARFILGLEPRDIWLPEAAGYGTLLHKVMEISQREFQEALGAVASPAERQALLRQLQAALTPTAVEDLFGRALREDPSLALFWEKGEAFGVRYKAMRAAHESGQALFDELGSEGILWVPALEEWAFGPETGQPFVCDFPDGGRLQFRGRIDRVDLAAGAEGRILARMIDYKTGSKTVSYNALYHGLDLQLPIYLEAFEALNGADYQACDAAYAPLNATIIHEKIARREDPDALEAEMKKRLALRNLDLDYPELKALGRHSLKQALQFARGIEAGQFPAAPRSESDEAPCRFCDYRALCGLDRGHIVGRKLPGVKELVLQKGIMDKPKYKLKENFEALMQAEYLKPPAAGTAEHAQAGDSAQEGRQAQPEGQAQAGRQAYEGGTGV